MKKLWKSQYKPVSLSLALAILLNPSVGFSYYLWSPESGKFVSSESQSQDYAEELFQHAISYQKQNKIDRAIEEFQNLIRKYPTAPNASEAQYQIGLIFEERKDYGKAVEAYKKVTENYPQSERTDAVAERLFKIGNLYMTGEKSKLAGMSIKSGLPNAIDIFEHIVKTTPYSVYGDQAQFNAGLTYKKMGSYLSAMEAFQKVIDQYPSSAFLDDARYQVAETSFEYSKRVTQDEKAIDQAVEKISDFLAHYPESSVTDKVNALKKEINNRDAEKNYRIGLYYEDEKQLESAALYFDDVVKRYPETEYGALAAKKLENLHQPLEKLRKEQREITLEMEAVGAKLKSLKSEQTSASDAERAKVLEEQIGSLQKQQQGLLTDQWQAVRDRESAFRKTEKEWRLKWRAFHEKRKEMRSNQAPELTAAFERWEKSLLSEKDALAKERATIVSLQYELKVKPEPKPSKTKKAKVPTEEPIQQEGEVASDEKTWWKPSFKISRKGKQDVLILLTEELNGIRSERERLFKNRVEKERELDRWQSELGSLEDQGFNQALTQPWFSRLIGDKKPELQQTGKVLNRHRSYLNRRVREFEIKKALHAKQYGKLDPARWSLTFSLEGFDVDEFVSSGIDLNQALLDLQQDKARLSDLWTSQKKTVETVAHASNVETGEMPKSKMPAVPKNQTVQEKDSGATDKKKSMSKNAQKLNDASPRILKKRIKFLEREIRQRFDEIQDWNQKKDELIAELNRLMQEGKPYQKLTKTTNAIAAPIRLAFWLARSVTFGLSNIDRRVVKQAKRREAEGDELSIKVRQLHEQIELESLLIQGRVAEINAFEKELNELKKLAGIKKIELIPIYTNRDFAIGEESLRSASRIVSIGDRDMVLIDKLNAETVKLQSIEQQLKIVNGKIEKMSQYQQVTAQKESAQIQKEEENAEDFELESTPAVTPSPEQLKSEVELDQLKKQIDRRGQKYQTEKRLYREELKKFYMEHAKMSPKKVSSEASHWNAKRQRTKKSLERTEVTIEKIKQSEYQLTQSEEKILLKKKKMIQDKLKNINSNAVNDQEKAVLTSELEACEAELVSIKDTLEQFQKNRKSYENV